MARTLARLRLNLDFMPSPVAERPGLLVRDPYQYSDTTLIIPPALVQCLEFFDGVRTDLDLRARLVRLSSDVTMGSLADHIIESLSNAGFLEDENFARRKEERERAFASAAERAPAHAGGAYPEEPGELQATLRQHLDGAAPAPAPLLGIAAPHVSPVGGWACYRDAYRALGPDLRERTFVILGTSHYGQPDHLGLTRKPFLTPLGKSETAIELVDRLEKDAADTVIMEDYCHAIEHSIEFQVVFLQHLYGPGIRILPVLCGPYATSLQQRGKPEDDEKVNRLLGALGELAAREGDRLFWVLGVDMAHMGRRYGDPFAACAERGEMEQVAVRDRSRIERIEQADAQGFWELVCENEDDLRWCGSAPIYTFLKAVPSARGRLLRYQQWNIDEQSVVSFAGMSFAG